MKKKIEIVKDEAEPIVYEVMERSIVQISESLQKISKTRISQKMIVALIQDDCKLGKGLIETVLLSLKNLEANYLRKK